MCWKRKKYPHVIALIENIPKKKKKKTKAAYDNTVKIKI